MLIRLGYDISFDVPAEVPIVALLNVYPSRVADLREPDELRVEHTAIAEGDAHVHGTIDHVIVRHNVAVRRDDDAAAESMLDGGLLLLLHGTLEKLAEG